MPAPPDSASASRSPPDSRPSTTRTRPRPASRSPPPRPAPPDSVPASRSPPGLVPAPARPGVRAPGSRPLRPASTAHAVAAAFSCVASKLLATHPRLFFERRIRFFNRSNDSSTGGFAICLKRFDTKLRNPVGFVFDSRPGAWDFLRIAVNASCARWKLSPTAEAIWRRDEGGALSPRKL